MTDQVEDFLAHYGIKGMRWGKRNSKVGSGSKRSAKASNDPNSDVTPEQLDAEMKSLGITSKPVKELYKKGSDRSDQLIEQANAKPKKRKPLTRGQKFAIAGGAAVVIGLAVYGGYKYKDLTTRNAKGGESISVKNFHDNSSMASLSFGYGAISKSKFAAMDTKDVRLPKGTIFKRVTADPHEDLSGMTYAAHTKADIDRYAGLFGPIVRERSGSTKLYQSSIELNTAVRSPSEKGRIQILIDLVKEDSGVRKQFIDYHSSNPHTDSKLSSEELILNSYGLFARNLARREGVADAYIKKVMDMGYNALIDDNNAKQIADSPIILLEANKFVEKVLTPELTRSVERAARRRLTEVMR